LAAHRCEISNHILNQLASLKDLLMKIVRNL
jgi:hypothetical protein